MNEETPRIETVELLKAELPNPEMPEKAVLPSSVIIAEKIRKHQLQNSKIEKQKNIFQLIQEQGMKSLLNLASNFIRNNWKTTVAGFAATVATWLAAKGITLGQHEIDAIMAIGYAVVFKFSNVKWDVATVVGVILMVVSFFVSPVIGAIGIGLDAGVITIIQLALQQAVGALLKDQKQIFLPEAQPAQ